MSDLCERHGRRDVAVSVPKRTVACTWSENAVDTLHIYV